MTAPRLVLPQGRRRRGRIFRLFRVIWQDTQALIKEFRRPLIAFILAVFVGGYIYGELLIVAGKSPVPYIDLPYYMLSLMILEPPTDVPTEPYLIMFWYLLPLIAVYIIGQGAADFFRLFFVRTERRDAWEAAVASTYRNHVILIGIGHVGFRVARTLVSMGFEVVALTDKIPSDVDDGISQLGIPVVVGDGRLPKTLRDAGIDHAQSIVICTSNDHINLEITMRARDLNPNIRIVTRMWDDRFASQLHRFMDVEVLSASDLAAPAFAGASVDIDITQTLSIAGEDYSMIKLQVRAGSFMDGQTIEHLQDDEGVDVVLHGRNGQEPDVHPPRGTIVQGGDTLVLFAQHSKITDIVSRNRP